MHFQLDFWDLHRNITLSVHVLRKKCHWRSFTFDGNVNFQNSYIQIIWNIEMGFEELAKLEYFSQNEIPYDTFRKISE